MPKRTNQFQQLITYIAEQVVPIGATVRESVELQESGVEGAIPREVDVLIELSAGIAPLRIAVECRDRTRKEDIQWIDDLIGKYRNLPVNQIIAVSSSDFSEPARKKAELNNIIVMSLEEASEVNWPEKFTKLGLVATEQHYAIEWMSFETTPELTTKVELDDQIIIKNEMPPDGVPEPQCLSIREFIVEVQDKVIEGVRQYVKDNFLTIYKVLADLNKDLLVERRVPANGIYLRTEDAGEFLIKAFTFHLRVRTRHSKLNVQRHLLSDKAMVTTAVVPDSQEPDAKITLAVVQASDKTEGRVFIERRRQTHKKKI